MIIHNKALKIGHIKRGLGRSLRSRRLARRYGLMKNLAHIILLTSISSCNINTYEKAANEIQGPQMESACCGRMIEWISFEPQSDNLQRHNYSPDFQQCVDELKMSNNSAGVPYAFAAVEILICMREHGWKADIQELTITP